MADPTQVTQEISALPASPTEGSGFRVRVMAFFAGLIKMAQQLEIFRTQVNAVAAEVNTVAVNVAAADAAATTATAQAGLASAAAATATEEADLASTAAATAVEAASSAGVFKVGAEAARDTAVAAAATAVAGGIAKPANVAKGDLLTFDSAGNSVRVPAGTPGQGLRMGDNGLPGFGDMTAQAAEVTRISNALFSVWSNGTLESTKSSVDLLGGTGNFESDADVAAWTAGNGATLTRDTSAAANGGGCLKITNNGATTGYATRGIETIIGNVYKVVCYAKRGTAVDSDLFVGTSAATSDIALMLNTSLSFNRLELTFEAVGTMTYITLINGNTSGGTGYFDSVTMYNMGPNLVTNGTFDSNTTGWTAYNSPSIFASVAGGVNGNCLQITNNGATYGGGNFSAAVIPGNLYRVSGRVKTSSGGPSYIRVGSIAAWSGSDLVDLSTTATSFTYLTAIFEATTSLAYFSLVNNNAPGASGYFDSITLTEVTVGCVDYNDKACDCWNKDPAVACFHETIRTKSGSSHAMRVYNGKVYWSDGKRATQREFYSQFTDTGAVVKGLWVQSSVAGKARVGIIDSNGEPSWSAYHPGDGIPRYLQVTRTPAAGITSFQTVVDSGAGAEAIFSQAQLQPGDELPEGVFVPIPNEFFSFPAIMSSRFGSWVGSSAFSPTALSVLVDSRGAIPQGARRVLLGITCNDVSSSAKIVWANATGASVGYDGIGDSHVHVTTQVQAMPISGMGLCPVDAVGNIYVGATATGTNTMYISLKYLGVQL